MNERIDLNRIPVSHIKQPSYSVVVEEEERESYVIGYRCFTTLTLQATLTSLRVTTAIHGQTARTREIEAAIAAELETRERE